MLPSGRPIFSSINSHLTAGTLWGLALLAFIAVYREVFENSLVLSGAADPGLQPLNIHPYSAAL